MDEGDCIAHDAALGAWHPSWFPAETASSLSITEVLGHPAALLFRRKVHTAADLDYIGRS